MGFFLSYLSLFHCKWSFTQFCFIQNLKTFIFFIFIFLHYMIVLFLERTTKSKFGTMEGGFLLLNIKRRRCMSQQWYLDTSWHLATMMTARRKLQVQSLFHICRIFFLQFSSVLFVHQNWCCPTIIFCELCIWTGGRNGYGAKLCNIFSTKFIVETSCKEYHKAFKQVRFSLID